MKKKYLILMLVLSGYPFASRLMAQDTVKIDFTAMDPHVGQNLYLRVVDQSDSTEIGRTSVLIDNAAFSLSIGGIAIDSSYNVDFYADYNENGNYDAPPTDHAWRIVLDSVQGDTTVNFVHNTDFTDIAWIDTTDTLYLITFDFSEMTPHVGQDLKLYLINTDDQTVDSVVISPIASADFSVEFDSIAGGNYNLDFYADHNQNGMYDAPPADHAWRLVLSDILSDTTVAFVHNTDFTDIFPPDAPSTVYQLSLEFSNMDPHVGQELILLLRDPDNGAFIDSINIDPVAQADFTVVFDSVADNTDYNLDFYADHNDNGVYDVPPTDHAWRIELTGIENDTTVLFVHNTTFTDIGLAITGIDDPDGEDGFAAYPNPARNELTVQLLRQGTGLSVYNAAGGLVIHKSLSKADNWVKLDVSALKPGLYILKLDSESGTSQRKFMKE